jgi:LacI family transcriptional regulator
VTSTASYDDIAFAAAATVPLTTVAQSRHLLGRTAVELMLAAARGTLPPDRRHVLLEPELVVRSSTRLRPAGG